VLQSHAETKIMFNALLCCKCRIQCGVHTCFVGVFHVSMKCVRPPLQSRWDQKTCPLYGIARSLHLSVQWNLAYPNLKYVTSISAHSIECSQCTWSKVATINNYCLNGEVTKPGF